MKRSWKLALILVLCMNQVSFAASNSIGQGVRTIKVNGLNKTVNLVTIDLNSPDIELGVSVSNDKIGGSEDFSSMIKRKNPVAAINANYFDAYESLEPFGTIMMDGKFAYMESSKASMLISDKRKVDMGSYKFSINGYLDGFRENKWNNKTQAMDFYLFKIWYVNNMPTDSTGVYLYTPERGNKVELKGGTAIEVIKDKITKITKNAKEANIPKDGYVIYYGNNKDLIKYVDARFKVGKTVELEYEIIENIVEEPKKEEPKKDEKPKSSKQTKLYGSINKETKNSWSNEKNGMTYNLFNIWYINSKPIDSSGVYLYTPERGASVDVNGGHAVLVENGKVSKVEFDIKKVNIPKKGFAIYFGKDSVKKEYIEARFEVGHTVDFYHEKTFKLDTQNIIKKAVEDNNAVLDIVLSTKDTPTEELVDNKYEGIISAGPYLVEDGKVVFDPNSSEFKEDKITINRAQRSAIGITKTNKLLLVTGSNLNMQELAQVMIELGAVKAMNLDGGASSGLYAKGKIITTPGRKLSTVLMIYDKSIK